MQNLFDDIEVPTVELDQVVQEKMKEIHTQCRKRKMRRIKGGCAAAAVLIVVGIGFCISNPVLASQIPLVGHLFERIQDKQYFPGNLSEVATSPDSGNVSESEGVKVTLSELYCNSQALYASFLIESEEAFPDYGSHTEDGTDELFMDAQYQFDFIEEPIQADLIQLVGEYVDEHTFAGAYRISFQLEPFATTTIPDTFQWDMEIKEIYAAANVEAKEDALLGEGGTWKFSVEVEKDDSKTVTKEVHQFDPLGTEIVSAVKTPFEIILKEEYHEDKKVRDDIGYIITLDADGKYMIDKVGMIAVGDHNVSKITRYYLPEFESEEELEAFFAQQYEDGFEELVKEYAICQIEIVFDEP
jgi:hypothetical protein